MESNKRNGNEALPNLQLMLATTEAKSKTLSKSKKEMKMQSQIARMKAADTQAAEIFGHQETVTKCLNCEELSSQLKSMERELQKEAEESQEEVKDYWHQ